MAMRSAKNGSGFVHATYGHAHRPSLLHVSCPKCEHPATAQKSSEKGKGSHITDLSQTMHLDDWQMKCSNCYYTKENLSFEALPPLYYRAIARKQEVWG